jgi:DNA-binding MarR family transcriptional regulator
MNAEKLTPTEASSLLGIPYEVVLRYTRKLEKQGLIQVHREYSGRLFLSPADLDLLRKHHENRPIGSRFMLEGDIEPHKHAVRDLSTLASTLEAMAKLARRRIKQMVQGPFSSTTWITTLPVVGLTLRKPIAVTVVSDGKAFSAFSADTGSTAYGQNRVQAVRALRKQLAAEYQYLGQLASLSEDEAERLSDLKGFISDSLREEVP